MDETIKSGIYQITNTVNGKFYIGSAKHFQRRWKLHLDDLQRRKHGNSKLQRAWYKYGAENFEFSIIEIVDDPALLIQREQYWIDTLSANKDGYNIRIVAHSNLGIVWPAEVRARMSESKKNPSLETRAKLSAARKLQKFSQEAVDKRNLKNTGRKNSEEARSRMSEAQRGRIVTEESRAKIAATLKGRKPTEEARARMSAAGIGRKPTAETLAKLSAWQKGKKKTHEEREANAPKLTFEKAEQIRSLYATGEHSHRTLAAIYSVDRSMIAHIVNNRQWLAVERQD